MQKCRYANKHHCFQSEEVRRRQSNLAAILPSNIYISYRVTSDGSGLRNLLNFFN